MRTWPYQMLDVLPYRQLLSQWRECLAISGMMAREGINHATINRIKDYPSEHFATFFYYYKFLNCLISALNMPVFLLLPV